jgi:hypothetical protein
MLYPALKETEINMSETFTPFIVEFSIGDGYTYSATQHSPILAVSKAAALDEFNTLMAAYVPDGPEKFLWCGQVFEYRNFVYWFEKQKTPRRVEQLYDVTEPTIYSVDEWVDQSLSRAEYEFTTSKITRVEGQGSPAAHLQARAVTTLGKAVDHVA